MTMQHNYLRTFRKQAPLSLSDLTAILGLSQKSSITRWEKGDRIPGIETLLVFHLLYGISIENFFNRQREKILPSVISAISSRLEELRQRRPVPKVLRRIAFLEAALIKLTQHK